MSCISDFLLSESQKRAAEDDGWTLLFKDATTLFSVCMLSFHPKEAAFLKDDTHLINEAHSFFFPSVSFLTQYPCKKSRKMQNVLHKFILLDRITWLKQRWMLVHHEKMKWGTARVLNKHLILGVLIISPGRHQQMESLSCHGDRYASW